MDWIADRPKRVGVEANNLAARAVGKPDTSACDDDSDRGSAYVDGRDGALHRIDPQDLARIGRGDPEVATA